MSKENLLGKDKLAERMEKAKQEMQTHKETDTANQPKPNLFISGRLDRKKNTYIAKSLMLLSEVDEEIKIYCRGGELAILNYLIKEGLKHVKKSGTRISVDMEEIESDTL